MDILTSIKSMKNMIVVKILAIFFICSGFSAIIFFTANYFIVRYSIQNVVIQDLNTTVSLIFDTMDLHFSRTEGQWYKFKDYLATGVIDPDLEARYNDLKFRLSKIQILNKGYIFIVNTKGDAIVHPEEEGKNLSEYAFIKEIIKKKNGVIKYEWKGKQKLVAYKYYAPFEWIIGAGSYYDDFLGEPLKLIIFASLILIVVIGIVVIGILYRLLTTIIIKPILKAKDIATNISRGDLTVTVDHAGQDEVGVMMSAMSDILTTQCGIISGLGAHIEKLSKSSGDMASISNKMSKMSQDQAAAMEEASAALEQNMANMDQIANRSDIQLQNVERNADKMDKMTVEAATSYEEANKVNNLMTSTAESARLGEQDLTKMVSEMQNIKDSTSKIADIIKIISDISEQVNLLSLNAAIEAARAGEHGRGFAVVADEISKLAEETAQSAKNITRLVSEGNEQVDSGTAIVNRTAQTFQKIIESIETTRGTISKFSQTLKLLSDTAAETRVNTESIRNISNEVSLATKEQMATNKELSTTVERVNTGSQELVNYAEVILKTSNEIGELSGEIKLQLANFKIA
jgi:methyl-accepting chemotaxis protein